MAVWVYLVRSFALYLVATILWFSMMRNDWANHPWLLFTLGLTGMYTGAWARHMRMWPCFVLVPRLSQRVFSLAIIIVVTTTLAASALALYAGGSVALIGPALLAGIYLAYAMVRRPPLHLLLAFPIICLPFFLTVAENRTRFESSSLVQPLSQPAAQISAIAIAAVFAAMLRRRLQVPAAQSEFNVLQTPFWVALLSRMVFLTAYSQAIRPPYTMSGRAMVNISVLTAAVVLAIDLSTGLAALGIHGGMFTTVVIMIWPSVIINDGMDFSVAWLTGRGRTRDSLARSVVARIIVAGALPMLAFLLAAEATRSLVGGGSASYEPLLVAQMAAFGLFALCFSFRGQFPNERANLLTALLLLAGLVIWLRAYRPFVEELQFGLGAYAVAALAVTASAVAAIYAVGWGLARADHLQ